MPVENPIWEFNVEHAPVDLLDEVNTETRQRLFDEATTIERLIGENNQQYSASMVNREALGNARPIIVVGEFLSSVWRAERVYQMMQFGVAFPDRPILSIDSPGHGESNPHSWRDIYQLCVYGNVEAVARPMMYAALNRLHHPEEVDIVGLSYGARLAVAMTSSQPLGQDVVRNVIAFELPGTARGQTQRIQYDSGRVERRAERRGPYEAVAQQRGMKERFQRIKQMMGETAVWAGSFKQSFFWRDKPMALLNFVRSPVALPTAVGDLHTLLKTKSAAVHVATGNESLIANTDSIGAFRRSLPAAQRDRFNQAIWPGDNHNLGLAYFMPRLAVHAAQAIDRLERYRSHPE